MWCLTSVGVVPIIERGLKKSEGKVGLLVWAPDFKSGLGAARAVLGRFDSCTFPLTAKAVGFGFLVPGFWLKEEWESIVRRNSNQTKKRQREPRIFTDCTDLGRGKIRYLRTLLSKIVERRVLPYMSFLCDCLRLGSATPLRFSFFFLGQQ